MLQQGQVAIYKIPRSQQRTFLLKLHKEQGGICPLCNKHIDLTEKGAAVMDHCHESGQVRGILHRSCNAAEGKVANAAGRWGAKSMEHSHTSTGRRANQAGWYAAPSTTVNSRFAARHLVTSSTYVPLNLLSSCFIPSLLLNCN